MKKIVGFAAFLLLAACNHDTDNASQTAIDSMTPSVIVPADTVMQNMPVKQLDTSRTDMPVMDPDTSNTKPL